MALPTSLAESVQKICSWLKVAGNAIHRVGNHVTAEEKAAFGLAFQAAEALLRPVACLQ